VLYIKGVEEINWTQLPSPNDVQVSYFDLSTAERAEDGTMYISFIAEKRRIDLTWTMLTDSQWSQILDAIRSRRPKFYVRLDTSSLGSIEMLAYVGDRKATLAFIRNNVRYWKDTSISLIEV